MAATEAEVVPAPSTDRPASSDPITEILLREREDARPHKALFGVGLAGVLVFGPLVWTAAANGKFDWLMAVWLAVAVVTTVLVLRGRRLGRWLTAGAARMHAEPWRPVTARVVTGSWGTTTVEIEEAGTFTALRVAGLSKAHHTVIARTGKVWVVGPTEGWAVVRIDGSHEPWPARVPARPPAPGAEFFPVDSAATTRLWARKMCARVCAPTWPMWWITGATCAFTLTGTSSWAKTAVGLAAWTLICGEYLYANRRRLIDLRLPRLVEAGEWTRTEATLAPWEVLPEGAVAAKATVRLDDGTALVALLPNASVDVLGAVSDTGTLWFAGKPEAGKTMAAGFPGYPLLAVARLR
ncbi:hypothetical protein [Actinokineospora iranica]|uniref:Uncharacterized protein n=1 Tax=Actinokineospora iranica TaxID=1271860 RepID=A0A1G6MWS4_9PSEU|nr:hypothetical protein [Actinokineospora iranica]SDC59993.1 hypothetical protein SAMN05216174_10372 [Actinokineospora iranica]